jgi:hypothetical protein
MKFYLCKYIPPRADFLATMTAEERKWMKQHGDFLNNLLDKGLIVAHGPVMDPSGGYGVSLYQIADDQGHRDNHLFRRPLQASILKSRVTHLQRFHPRAAVVEAAFRDEIQPN